MSAQTPPVGRRRRLAMSLLVAVAVSGGAVSCGVSVGDDLAAESAGRGASGTAASTSTVALSEGSFEGTGGAVFLRRAAAATSDVTTQKVTMTMASSGGSAPDVLVSYEGAFDNETGRGRMVIDMSDVFGSLGDGGQRMELVVDGDTVYMRSALFSALAGGKTWVSMSEEGLSESGAAVGVQGDPTAVLDFLDGVGDELETVGREHQRGVSTTHVRTEIDMTKFMEEASSDDRAEYEDALGALSGAPEGFGVVPVDVWVDDDGYVRRLRMTFGTGAVGDIDGEVVDGLSMSMDIELYDFNEPVDIEVPDPSDVAALPSLSPGN